MSIVIKRRAIDRLLETPDVDVRLEVLENVGILGQLFPSVQRMVGFGDGVTHKDLWQHTKQVVKQTRPVAKLRWAALFHDVGKPHTFSTHSGKVSFHHHEGVSARLFRKEAGHMFETAELNEISFVIEHLGRIEAYESDWPDSAVRRLIIALGPHLAACIAVSRADCTTGYPEKRAKQLRRSQELEERCQRIVEADALPPALPKGLGMAISEKLGIEPGPELGIIMAELKKRVESGELPRNAKVDFYLECLECDT